MKSPYETISRDCQTLHSFTTEDIKKFIAISKIKPKERVLDAMAGNGSIAKELLNIKDIEIFVLDNSKIQIDLAKKNLKKARFFKASIMKMPFLDSFFDKVFIRNGVYEVPKNSQLILYSEIYRVLKPTGKFINWTVLLNKENQEIFNKIANKKDELAGFDKLKKDRYFMTKQELLEDLKEIGFRSILSIDLDIDYTLSTKKWFEVDFNKDKSKLKKLNEYIESIDKKELGEIKIVSKKDDIIIKIPALITIAEK